MPEVAKVHSDRLTELKKHVEASHQYFDENVQRYEKFRNFVFNTSLTNNEISALASTGKPSIEFNITEAVISRLRGEFAKQQPNLTVHAADGIPTSLMTPEFSEMLDVVEAHLRAVSFNGTNDMLDYKIYTDLLSGGFSVGCIYTEYLNEKSVEQNIVINRVFDPTLTGFDPLARESHKGDGRYCFELYPMTIEEFEEEFGKEASDGIKYVKNIDGFSWSYANDNQKIVLVCDFYEKKKTKAMLFKLSNGYTLLEEEYKDFLVEWEKAEILEQPPIPVLKRRTQIERIYRYRFCETKVLSHDPTIFKHLPLVFFDGNSIELKQSGSYKQMTRPYVYHAEGIQRLKNFAGQSLANELENTVQHKFIAAVEGIPQDYLEAYQNVQKADVLLYKHFQDTHNPDVTIPPPREVMRTPIPPEISNTFRVSDEMMQTILGNYDGAQGITDGKLSGIAFARSAIQSNNASVPYLVGYIQGWNRLLQIMVDLIPKVYKGERMIPVLNPEGENDYKKINKDGHPYMNFDPNHLQVKVEMGVNFAMQKEIAVQTLIEMSRSNKGFAQFFDDEGLTVLLDNIDIRGIDQLKEKAKEWMANRKQQQQAAQQQQQQMMQMQSQKQAMEMATLQKELQSPSPGQLGAMALQQQARTDDANVAIKNRAEDTKFIEIISKIQNADVEMALKASEVDAENARTAVDAAVQLGNHINETLSRKEENGKTDNQSA